MVNCVNLGIVDYHPLFREGVRHTLNLHQNFEVVGEGASCEDVGRIVQTCRPDVLLLDAELPGGSLKALQKITTSNIETKIVVLTANQSEKGLSEFLSAGASGYTSKCLPTAELINVILTVQNGDLYTDPIFAANLLAERYKPRNLTVDPVETLTAREYEILTLVAESMTNKEIARKCNIAEKTVKHYMTLILGKLKARNRVEAALIARRYLLAS